MSLYRFRVITLLLIFAFIFPLFVPGVESAREDDSLADQVAVVLVVDISGSMARTDPQELRVTACELFIDLLGSEDYLGIIAFDHEAEVLEPLRVVGEEGGREAYKKDLAERLKPRGNTDFVRALDLAYEELERADTGNARPMVLFLTDGEPDPDSARREDPALMQEHLDDLWETVGRYSRQNYPVYSVAFSDEIDPEIMERISRDTRARTYIHEDPGGLAESFFRMLGDVKNRYELWEEDMMLELHGGEEVVEFDIDEHVRQANLVFAGRNLSVSVEAPGGVSTQEVGGVSINARDGYTLVVLQEPGEEHQGTWRAAVSGEDTARAMGSADFYVKTWLEQPLPYSQYPLNEPLPFKIRTAGVEGLDESGAAKPGVEIELRDPDGKRIALLPLTEEEEGVFGGTYEEGLSRRGTHDVIWRVSLEGTEVSRGQAEIYARVIPVLGSDFWVEDSYRQGEELVVTAFFRLGGDRLTEGRNLEIEEVALVLNNGDGSPVSFPLFDDGNPEHGDLRAGDGIYSARINLQEEGVFKGRFVGSGRYQGEEFLVEKPLDEFAVYPPGSIAVGISREKKMWAVPGGTLSVPLRVENESELEETLVIALDGGIGTLSSSRVQLAPGEVKNVVLSVELDEELELGEYLLPLSFSAGGGVTTVHPGQMDVSVELLSSGAAVVQRLQDIFSVFLPLGLLMGAAAGIAYFGGGFFYRFLVVPRSRVKGTLLFWNGEGKSKDTLPQKINLGKVRRNKVMVSLGQGSEEAEFKIPSGEFEYDIIFENEMVHNSPQKFLLGWKALFRRVNPVKTFVRCSRPGIMEFGGTIYTSRELFHADEFESGGFVFQYFKDAGENGFEDTSGVNLLEGREWSLGKEEDADN